MASREPNASLRRSFGWPRNGSRRWAPVTAWNGDRKLTLDEKVERFKKHLAWAREAAGTLRENRDKAEMTTGLVSDYTEYHPTA